MAHNHPSGDPTPSGEDIAATEQLMKAGKILGIELVEHLIVAREGWFGFGEKKHKAHAKDGSMVTAL